MRVTQITKFCLITAFVGLTALSTAIAQEKQAPAWVYLGEYYVQDQSYDLKHKGEMVLTKGYIDQKTIKKIDFLDGHRAELYQYSYLEEFTRPLKIGNFSVGYRAKTNYTNCEEKNTGTGYVKLYDSNNKLISQMDISPPKMLRIKDDTISEKILNYLCQHKYE